MEKGFSLIELLLAAAITAIIVLGFAQIFIRNNIALNHARMQTLAHNWAADAMEDLKSQFYADISTGTSTDVSDRFTRNVTVSENEETEPGIKVINIDVTWEDLGRENTVRLASYIADY